MGLPGSWKSADRHLDASGANTYTRALPLSSGGILRITGNYTGGGGITMNRRHDSNLERQPDLRNGELATGGVAAGITVNTTGTATFGTIGLNGGNLFFTVTKGTAIVGQISENAAGGSRHLDVNGGVLDNSPRISGGIPGVLESQWRHDRQLEQEPGGRR